MDKMPEVKPGKKSTEFGMSIAGAILGIAVLLGFISPDESLALNGNIQTIVGGAISAVSVVGYAISRARTKGSATDSQTILNAIASLSNTQPPRVKVSARQIAHVMKLIEAKKEKDKLKK
jgi:uncharacterized protein (DUF697 family)